MELLAAPQVHGEVAYYSLLIVGHNLNATALGELQGASFAFSDPLSNSGRLAPLYHLALRGESPDSFFGRTVFTYSYDSSIRAVADGVVTAAAVDSLVFDYLNGAEPGRQGATTLSARDEALDLSARDFGGELSARGER